MRFLHLLIFASPLFAQDFPVWNTKGPILVRDGQPRLLLAISDLEPKSQRLAAYHEAGLDAVWIRSFLNDTPDGINRTLEVINKGSLPLIGHLPVNNLSHTQTERIRPLAKVRSIAAWLLCTSDLESLREVQDADSDTLCLVSTDEFTKFPARSARYQHAYRPNEVSNVHPTVIYANIGAANDSTALELMLRLAAGADGLVFSVNYKGVPIGDSRVDWLRNRIPLLRAFHNELQKRPLLWEEMKSAEGLTALKADTAAGTFVYCNSELEEKSSLKVEPDDLVVFQTSAEATWKDGKITFSKPGSIWLGPKSWHDRMTKPTPSTPSAEEEKNPLKEIVDCQKVIEERFTFCASVLAQLSFERLERHLPVLLPFFKRYYGDSITPLAELKSADGKTLDISDLAIASEVEDFVESLRTNDNLGTQALTGQNRQPLKQQIQQVSEKETAEGELRILLSELKTLRDTFHGACLRWESSDGSATPLSLHPVGNSKLVGGLVLLNFSNEPVEMLLADGAMEKELWTSSLISPESAPPPLKKLIENSSGIQSFGKTLAVNYSVGYTVMIPPGGQREFMNERDKEGNFYFVQLNRFGNWASKNWELFEEEHSLAGSGTKILVEQKLSKPPVIWPGQIWEPLDTLAPPPEDRKPLRRLQTHLYKGEWQTVGFTIHNPNDAPMALFAVQDVPLECTLMAYAYTRAQDWSRFHGGDVMLELRHSPPDRPVPEGPVNGNLIYLNAMGEFWVPPHQTRQVFLIFKANRNTEARDYSGHLHLIDVDGNELEAIELNVKVWPLTLPPKTSFHGTGYTIGSAIYRPKNAQDAFDHYFNHMVLPAVQPEITLDWENETLLVGDVDDSVKETSDFKGSKRLADMGFSILLSGWGATGMKTDGGVGGFVDEFVRKKHAAAEGAEANSALEKLATDLTSNALDTEEEEEEDDFEIDEEEEEEKPKTEADLLREKADRLKKKYRPGSPGYEKMTQQVYKKSIDYYIKQGFPQEQLLSYVWDEAPRSHFPAVIRMAEQMKKVHPKVRTYVTCLPNLSDFKSRHAIDVYAPHMGHVYDAWSKTDAVGHAVSSERRNARNLKRYHDKDKELWIYMQHGGYLQGKFAVDYPMGLLWRAWQMDLKGVGMFSIRNCRGDLGYYPSKCYEAWREGVEDFLAMRSLEADIKTGRNQGIDKMLIEEAEKTLREQSQEVLGNQWWWSDGARRYRLIRAARLAIAQAHLKLRGKLR